jgi:hypothetical protein
LLAAASCGAELYQFVLLYGANIPARISGGRNATEFLRACGHSDVKALFKVLGVKSLPWFKVGGLTSRLSFLSLEVESANVERELAKFFGAG